MMWKMGRKTGINATDKVIAVLYLILGYVFIWIFTSGTASWSLSAFTVIYAVVVLGYLYSKGKIPEKESWFWLAVMLMTGLPITFYSVFPVIQILALMAVAAYWTLSAGGRLIDAGRTSGFVGYDVWNALGAVPFLNFLMQGKVLLGMAEKVTGENLDEEETGKNVEEQAKMRNDKMNTLAAILLGAAIVIPIFCILLPLLSSADAGFEHLLGGVSDYIYTHLFAFLLRMLFAIPVSCYLFGLVYGSIYGKNANRITGQNIQKTRQAVRILPMPAVVTILAAVCAVYILFIGVQGNYFFSALAGRLPEAFTYAEYARRGFFELCQAGVWNLLILWFVNRLARVDDKENRWLKTGNILLSGLTLVLILTAAGKMMLYILAYGLTVNRMIPMVFMVWMAVIFSSMIVRQYRRFPMVRNCVMIGALLFCALCVFPVEHWTGMYNAWRFPG